MLSAFYCLNLEEQIKLNLFYKLTEGGHCRQYHNLLLLIMVRGTITDTTENLITSAAIAADVLVDSSTKLCGHVLASAKHFHKLLKIRVYVTVTFSVTYGSLRNNEYQSSLRCFVI